MALFIYPLRREINIWRLIYRNFLAAAFNHFRLRNNDYNICFAVDLVGNNMSEMQTVFLTNQYSAV